SGNPRGRPRKPKPPKYKLSDATFDGIFEHEVFRPVRVTENGKSVEMPIAQAIQRRRMIAALQGSRLQQKDILRELKQQEEHHYELKSEHYKYMEKIKSEGERVLAEHEAKGDRPPLSGPIGMLV